MKEGHLYCEQCGEEIHIVPEFEAEIENSIHATLSSVATEITAPENTPKEKTPKSRRCKKKGGSKRKKRKKKILVIVSAIAAIVCLAGILWGITYFLPEYQYKSAVRAMKKEHYEEAAGHFNRALTLSPKNVSYLNGLSDCYVQMGDLKNAEETCKSAIALEGSNAEAYKRLVDIYKMQQDYESISELILNCQDNEIINTYLDYMAAPPDFDLAGGTYHEKQTLKLIGRSTGNIYFTTDGSDPDENSEIYTTPIMMESGTFDIKAIFINQYGVKSPVVEERYYVEISRAAAPVVLPASGTYGMPCLIEAEVPENCKVYYTTDGSDPDISAILYEEPFWMPAGYSTIKFAVLSPGGVIGEIAEMNYTLNLKPVLSIEAASNQLLLCLIQAGIIENLQGDLTDYKGRNCYTYKYPLVINDNRYYLYREYYVESDSISNSTGNDYVVNYMSGECYRAVMQKDKTFKLYTIEEESDDVIEEES